MIPRPQSSPPSSSTQSPTPPPTTRSTANRTTSRDRSSDELGPFLAVLDRYLVEHVDALRIDASHALPPRHIQDLAELGAFGVTLPSAFGGAGLGLHAACRVIDTLARRDRAVATTVGLHLGLGTRGLVAFGTRAQHERYLPKLATGQTLAAFATTEPNAGSDLMRLSTRLTLAATGATLSGQKLYVTNGGLAGLFTLTAAVSDPARPHTADRALVLVERGSPGITIGPEEVKLGLRGSSTTPVFFDEVPIDRAQLLGSIGASSDELGHILAWGRTAMAAGCCGTAQSAFDKTLAHTHHRRQFGRPLASQPVVRGQLATMAATLHTMRALVIATTSLADQLASPSSPDAADSQDRGDPLALERLSLSTKVFASDGDYAICDLALQLHGGSGYLEESGLPLLLRDARITRIFEGANDVLLTRRGQLELTLRTPPPRSDELLSALTSDLVATARARGLAALRDPLLLHRLGRLATLADAADALDALTPPEGSALGAHARELLHRQAWTVSRDLPMDTLDAALAELIPHDLSTDAASLA